MSTHSALEEMVKGIKFQINKHGQILGKASVEDAVNDLSPYELLGLIAEYMDAHARQGPRPPIVHTVTEFKEIFMRRFGVLPNMNGHSTGAVQDTAMLTGFLLGRGYSFDEIDSFARSMPT